LLQIRYSINIDHPDIIALDYALGNSIPGVPDHNTGKMYYNLLDAQRYTASHGANPRKIDNVHME
jgi:hypothetical protein